MIITADSLLLRSKLDCNGGYDMAMKGPSVVVVLRFHQLSKTKLGLSIFPFLVIDDNLFTKIFNEIFLDSYCLPKHFTMCDMDTFHKPELVALAPPTYVLRV